MYTVVRVLPPGITPWARANSSADFDPGAAQRRVSATARGDLTDVVFAISPSAGIIIGAQSRNGGGRHGAEPTDVPQGRHRGGGHAGRRSACLRAVAAEPALSRSLGADRRRELRALPARAGQG